MSPNPPTPPPSPAVAATPAVAPAPAPVAIPPPPVPGPELLTRSNFAFRAVDYSLKGYHLEATLSADQVVAAASEMSRYGFALDTITGVDWLAEKQMEVVYDYFHPETSLRVVIRSRIDRANPELPTISQVYPGANWHERETHDFFGVKFLGHPNLQPFLLPEDATFHPLRKDFVS
jgi:NADH-quinone oxidoreductase subunit C